MRDLVTSYTGSPLILRVRATLREVDRCRLVGQPRGALLASLGADMAEVLHLLVAAEAEAVAARRVVAAEIGARISEVLRHPSSGDAADDLARAAFAIGGIVGEYAADDEAQRIRQALYPATPDGRVVPTEKSTR